VGEGGPYSTMEGGSFRGADTKLESGETLIERCIKN